MARSANTSPLTPEEKRWCAAMEKLLMATPARFGLSVTGDPYLDCFDADAEKQLGVDIADGGAQTAGIHLATIKSRVHIHSLAG